MSARVQAYAIEIANGSNIDVIRVPYDTERKLKDCEDADMRAREYAQVVIDRMGGYENARVVPLVSGEDYDRALLDEAPVRLTKLQKLTKELVDSLPPCPTCDTGVTTKKTCGYSRALVKVMKELGK